MHRVGRADRLKKGITTEAVRLGLSPSSHLRSLDSPRALAERNLTGLRSSDWLEREYVARLSHCRAASSRDGRFLRRKLHDLLRSLLLDHLGL